MKSPHELISGANGSTGGRATR